MRTTQVIDPHVLSEFLILNQDFLRPKFPDAKRTSKLGRPRIGLRWVLAAICLFARQEQIVWRDLPSKLRLCDFLIKAGYLKHIPSKSTFHRAWDEVSQANLESLIKQLGFACSQHTADVAIDSSGFELTEGSFWRLLKWGRQTLTKSSPIFVKLHLAVGLPSRAVVGVCTSSSAEHDATAFGRLWKGVYRRLIPPLRRVHADRAYWSGSIIGLLAQESLQAVIPKKSNSRDHGTSSPMDRLVRLQSQHRGIYVKNCRVYLRAEVKHVFGHLKQRPRLLRDHKLQNKLKSLLCSVVWYNHRIRAQGVIPM